MTLEVENKKYEFDMLTAERINQMVSIWEGNVLEMMKRNPAITNKAKEFMLALNSTALNFVDNSLDDISGGKVGNDKAPDGIARNAEQLEALKKELVDMLVEQFPNLSQGKIESYVNAFAGSVTADKQNIAEASNLKAEEDAKAAKAVAGFLAGIAIGGAGVFAGTNMLTEHEEGHNCAAEMLKNPIMQILLGSKSKSKDSGIMS